MNTGMIELNIVGMVLCILLLFHGKTSLQNQHSLRFFYYVLLFLLLTLTTKTLLSFIGETTSQGIRLVAYFLLMGYALFSVISAFCWFIFVHETAYEAILSHHFFKLFSCLPLLVWFILIFQTPFNHWLFLLHKKAPFTQENILLMQTIFIYAYIFLSALSAFINYKKASTMEKRSLCLHLFVCALIPLLGKSIEFIFPWLDTTIPGVLSSMLFFSLSILKKEILLDPLTQLYNRRKFQHYLEQNAKDLKQEKLLLVFFDINHFKSINDNFGHIEGDKALILVAQTLQAIFSDTKAFIARYGGDEFVVILPKSKKEILFYLDAVDHALAELTKNLPYTISVSVGYSTYGEEDTTTLEGLVQAADKKMYRDKQSKNHSVFE